ncbi:MAG: hypothetical protein HY898_24050 [Deltaproteobacteria bacterium]|nr:hypothetical protein [Deltaproteobacteria bacterium]
MQSTTLRMALALTALGSVQGCVYAKAPSPPPGNQSFAAYQQAKLESVRQEFIQQKSERLQAVQTEIERLDARLTHEAPYADAEERAAWSQRLWELRQEQTRLQAEVDRARTATPAEWREMRGPVGNAIDVLQANAVKIAHDIDARFRSQKTENPTPTAQNRLCTLKVADQKTTVQAADDHVELTVVTANKPSIDSLRERAEAVAKTREYRAADPEQKDRGSPVVVPVRVSVEPVTDGVKLKFTPDQPAQLATLQSAIGKDAQVLRSGGC